MFCTDPERQSLTQTADDGDDGSVMLMKMVMGPRHI